MKNIIIKFKSLILISLVINLMMFSYNEQRVKANPLVAGVAVVSVEAVIYLGCVTLCGYQVISDLASLSDIDFNRFKSEVSVMANDVNNFIIDSTGKAISWSEQGWAKIKAIITSYEPNIGVIRIADNSYIGYSSRSVSQFNEDFDYIPVPPGTYTINTNCIEYGKRVHTVTVYDGGGIRIQENSYPSRCSVYLTTYYISDGKIITSPYFIATDDPQSVSINFDFKSEIVGDTTPDGVWDKVKAQGLESTVGSVACPVTNTGTIDAPILSPTYPLAKDWTLGNDYVWDGTGAIDVPTDIPADATTADTIADGITSTLDVPDSVPTLNFKPLYLSFATKFPFCVPFDFINSIKAFSVGSKAPSFTIDFNDAYFRGGGTFVFDFKNFEKLILVIRYLMLLAFIVGLIKKTRAWIGGGGAS